MTAYYLACGSMSLLALAHLSNAPGANRIANAWLGAFFLCAAGALLAFIAERTGLNARYPLLIPLTESIRFAMAPSLYFCVRYFTAVRHSWARTDYLHFLPALLFLPLLFSGGPHLPRFLGILVGAGVKLQLLIYWILSLRLLYKHSRVAREITAVPQKIDLKWLKWLLLAIAAIMVLWYNQAFRVNGYMDRFAGIGYLLAIYLLGFWSLRQRQIFPYTATENAALAEVLQKKAGSPRLTGSAMQALKVQLAHLMEKEQVFTDTDLTLPKLAGRMGISVHELSYLLNNGHGQNFYQYINQLRVNRAKELMHSEKHRHLSILGIAFEAGFNSKTTFNTAFRKMIGMSPTEFRDLPVRMDTSGQ